MKSSKKYTCVQKKLHPELQKKYQPLGESPESIKFQNQPVKYSGLTWFIILFLRICGLSHYDTMALMGYDSYLLDQKYINSILQNKKRKKLLDIGAGSGSITKLFQPFVDKIFYLESSYFFRRKLQKMGFSEYNRKSGGLFDIILMFNVLDRCSDARKMIQEQLNNLEKDGLVIISLPFPIHARHGHGIQNTKQKALTQDKNITFEQGASKFYEEYLQNTLNIMSFSRTPYMLLSPEMGKIKIFDNAIFVCQKK